MTNDDNGDDYDYIVAKYWLSINSRMSLTKEVLGKSTQK